MILYLYYYLELYRATQKKVTSLLQTNLNFIADESSNIRRERVQNLCVSVKEYGAFYLESEPLQGETLDGEWNANWLHKKLSAAVSGEFSRINSITTDTCPTQKKAARILAGRQEYQKVFFVSCDSHELQLLIKNILKLS